LVKFQFLLILKSNTTQYDGIEVPSKIKSKKRLSWKKEYAHDSETQLFYKYYMYDILRTLQMSW
jgi:hypothetical protein